MDVHPTKNGMYRYWPIPIYATAFVISLPWFVALWISDFPSGVGFGMGRPCQGWNLCVRWLLLHFPTTMAVGDTLYSTTRACFLRSTNPSSWLNTGSWVLGVKAKEFSEARCVPLKRHDVHRYDFRADLQRAEVCPSSGLSAPLLQQQLPFHNTDQGPKTRTYQHAQSNALLQIRIYSCKPGHVMLGCHSSILNWGPNHDI